MGRLGQNKIYDNLCRLVRLLTVFFILQSVDMWSVALIFILFVFSVFMQITSVCEETK